MKTTRILFAPIFFLMSLHFTVIASKPDAGFFLPDSIESMTLTYRVVKGLIVLPVILNDSINVNLVLDTGCRNLILFGRKFKKLFHINPSRRVEFSGLGNGRPLSGMLSLGNKVSISHVLGERIPVVIVAGNDVFEGYHRIDGVIGYDIFLRFEIELNPLEHTITFRPAQKSSAPPEYTKVQLQIVDARPVLTSQIYLGKGQIRKLQLMIDTGSSLGLLLKTTNISEFRQYQQEKIIGLGFNGPISGYQTTSERVVIEGLEITDVSTGIVSSSWHNNASIGMDILKDYVVILNYAKQYACFRRQDT